MSDKKEIADWVLCLAHTAVERYLKDGVVWEPPVRELPDFLRQVRGAFTTLYDVSRGRKDLRGCIGIPLPVYPLAESIVRSAIEAAIDDPRFSPVSLEELPKLMFSVDILSPLKPIRTHDLDDLKRIIEIGKHGLIIKYRGRSGLLLPKVPVEFGWTVEEFLAHLCVKAGLPPVAYQNPQAELYMFSSDSFSDEMFIE